MNSDFTKDFLDHLANEYKNQFNDQNNILSFDEYLNLFSKKPEKLIRNSAKYMVDMFKYYGFRSEGVEKKSFLLFEKAKNNDKPPIVGQEKVHGEIFKILEQFVRQGKIDKLILLHGPNGSSKSSTAEIIANGLEEYSKTEEGAVYKFNWIFPNDHVGFEGLSEQKHKNIGFIENKKQTGINESFAHLNEDDILCRIASDMKEHPLYILPTCTRKHFLQKIYTNLSISSEVPDYILRGSLSTKNKKIFDQLIVAYSGDMRKVFNHIQVERFYFSKKYRSGVATVEPQMSIDAHDKQINYEKNIQNIPPVLQNIRLYEIHGELIDANRGFIEYSDLLKRPLEAFKYLLTTIENMNIHLASGIVDLDLIMMASTNEKHLDAFKNSPDWASFKGRFELIRVPYLLRWVEEKRIYEEDVKTISKVKPIGPHALNLLCIWAVLTRLRQPDAENYPASLKQLIMKIDPFQKLCIYNNEETSEIFSEKEKHLLKKHVNDILNESRNLTAYEGRFGASPREIKQLLYYASQNEKYDSVSTLSVFEELDKFVQDTTLYDFLQFECRGEYHDAKGFVKHVKEKYKELFYNDFLSSLNLYDEKQYSVALENYLKSVIAFLKNEKVFNEITGKSEAPNESLMEEIEKLICIESNKRIFRENIVAKIAAWRVENPNETINIQKLFQEELSLISKKIYLTREEEIKKIRSTMLMYNSDDYTKTQTALLSKSEEAFNNLSEKFNYTRQNVQMSLSFLNT